MHAPRHRSKILEERSIRLEHYMSTGSSFDLVRVTPFVRWSLSGHKRALAFV
jgi:hypothetical protein